jgi:hypothetical protein
MGNGEKEARKQRINRFFLSIYDNLPLFEQGDNNDRKKRFFLLIEFFLTILTPIYSVFDIFFTLLLFISLLYSTKIFHLKFDILPVFFFYNAIIGRFLPFLISGPLSRLFTILPVPFSFYTIDGLVLHTFLFLFYLKKSKTGTKKLKLYTIIFFFSAFLLGQFFTPYVYDGILFLIFLITSIYLIRKNIKAQPKHIIFFIVSLFYLCLTQYFSPNNFYIFFSGLLSKEGINVYIRSIITLVGLFILYISTILYLKIHDYQQNRKIVSVYFILYLITDIYFYIQVPKPVPNIIIYILAVLVFYLSFLNNGIIGSILLYLSTAIPPFISLFYSHYSIRKYEVFLMIGNFLLKSLMIFLLVFLSNRYKRKMAARRT